jgi:hypothetical protein
MIGALAGRALAAGALLLGGAAGGSGAGGGSASGSPTGTPPLASATLEQCTVAVDQPGRAATFNGQMSAVPGTRRMAMQILVQEQAPGETEFHTLPAATSDWRHSEAGVKIYKFVRQVTDLPASGSFRALVLFRWLGEDGHVIKRAARHTDACVQPTRSPVGHTQPPALSAPSAGR